MSKQLTKRIRIKCYFYADLSHVGVMFTFTHVSFPTKYSESTQQIKMAKMAVAKDSDRGLTWTHDETPALIWIWADSEIQKDFETCRRNASIYEKLATRLREPFARFTLS